MKVPKRSARCIARLRRWNWTASRSSCKKGEFGNELGELTAKAAFLESEIAEVFFVSTVNEGFEHGCADLLVGFVSAFASEFMTAESVIAGFESGNAEQAPFGIGYRLAKVFFVGVERLILAAEDFDEVFVSPHIVRWQEDGAAGETGFDGIVGRLELPFRRRRAGTVLRIRAVGVDLRFGGHKGYFRFDWNRRANRVYEILAVSN